jgi:hypothetical protein
MNFRHIIKAILPVIITILTFPLFSQVTEVVVLNHTERLQLQAVLRNSSTASALFDSILVLAQEHLENEPDPAAEMLYEGLLPTHEGRMITQKKLQDVDKTIDLLYAWYGSGQEHYARKAKDFVMAWAKKHNPDGNPINDHKVVPFFWTYHVLHDFFAAPEKAEVDKWMKTAAGKNMLRQFTPNNNWEVKRLKIIGVTGCLMADQDLIQYSIQGFKQYIESALHADGSSNDLHERDALHYHVSGLKPLLETFINCSSLDKGFDLYHYTASSGSSASQSVEFTYPYARGEKQRSEWTKSTAQLDRRRAAAGLAEYQPGMLFDPRKAYALFEWAVYYNADYFDLWNNSDPNGKYIYSWIAFLNSPLVRQRLNDPNSTRE